MEISNQTFRAKHLAVTKNKFKNVTTKIDLYELTSKDKKFLEKLKDSVDFDKSLRDMPEFDRKRWQKVFNYAVESAQIRTAELILPCQTLDLAVFYPFLMILKVFILMQSATYPSRMEKGKLYWQHPVLSDV